ncbi:MAG: hypothetical protein AB7F99_20310 [Vicinamibacterales bacterium]
MINYTERLTLLMHDIVTRVPALNFIDISNIVVFARAGRTSAEGAYATCHCLTLPPSEPGYYFWRDHETGRITRRSEWFVTKSPSVTVGSRPINYLISFALPRYCDQSLGRSRKERFYHPEEEPWMAKLDTVVHELYHIAPDLNGIRRIDRGDGTYSANCHGHHFFSQVADMVQTYLDSKPDPSLYEFLRYDFDQLETMFGGVVGTSFRSFPSYPQRYVEPLRDQPPTPADPEMAAVEIVPVRTPRQPQRYTEDDLHVRQFTRGTSRRLVRKGAFRAA